MMSCKLYETNGVKGNWARRGKAEKAKLSKAVNEGVRESVIIQGPK